MLNKKTDSSNINGLSRDHEKLLVQKSLPLFSLWQSELTLPELKILDIYLARINSHEPEKRVVKFTKGEMEKILGVKRIRPKVLDQRLANLMTSIKVEESEDNRYFTRITLFEKANARQDEEGYWTVELRCTESAMQMIFNIENIGYLRYYLKNIIPLKSRYSYIMYLYLQHSTGKYRGKQWEVSLLDLKKILHCENDETYKEYKRFNDLVLKKVQAELLEKTDIHYEYEPVKNGRHVIAIKFTVKKGEGKFIPPMDKTDLSLDFMNGNSF